MIYKETYQTWQAFEVRLSQTQDTDIVMVFDLLDKYPLQVELLPMGMFDLKEIADNVINRTTKKMSNKELLERARWKNQNGEKETT